MKLKLDMWMHGRARSEEGGLDVCKFTKAGGRGGGGSAFILESNIIFLHQKKWYLQSLAIEVLLST